MKHVSFSENVRSLLKPKIIVLIISLFASAFLALSALLTQRSIQKNIENSLTLQALGIEIVLLSILKNFDFNFLQTKKGFLSDLIINERWDGVAFIALYDDQKRILLHSNPELLGQILEKSPWLEEGRHTHYLRLKTGEEVFIYENRLPLRDFRGNLRIALHVQPVAQSLSYAKIHLYFESFLAFFFLSGGFVAFFLLSHLEKNLNKIEELERWQFITKILLHEIKNPLATIKGYVQYLQRKIPGERHHQALDLMLKETIRIERLLRELSLFSYPVEPDWRETHLQKVIEEVKTSIGFLHPESIIKLHMEPQEITIRSDPHMLKSILFNLLENALQASFEKGKKEISLSLQRRDNLVFLEIIDQGVGIDEENLDKIFEPFFTTKARGTGLGLAIVKKLCDSLGIEISLKSKKGEGTKVRLTIKSPVSSKNKGEV